VALKKFRIFLLFLFMSSFVLLQTFERDPFPGSLSEEGKDNWSSELFVVRKSSGDIFSGIKDVSKRPGIILIEGHLIFSLYPKASGGTDGSWQPVIISPFGERIAGPNVPFDSLDPVVMNICVPDNGFLQTGFFGIQINNNIENASPSNFIDSITVALDSEDYVWDMLRIRDIPPSMQGEHLLFPYLLPVPDQDHDEG
jgi:hypothetical protein